MPDEMPDETTPSVPATPRIGDTVLFRKTSGDFRLPSLPNGVPAGMYADGSRLVPAIVTRTWQDGGVSLVLFDPAVGTATVPGPVAPGEDVGQYRLRPA